MLHTPGLHLMSLITQSISIFNYYYSFAPVYTSVPAETTIWNHHVVSRKEMQTSDANPRIRPNTPILRNRRRIIPLIDKRSCPTHHASLATSPYGRGCLGEPGAHQLRVHRFHPRWIPSNHLHPMPASLPWVLQRPDSRSTKESPGLRFMCLRQHEWLYHPTLADNAVSTQ